MRILMLAQSYSPVVGGEERIVEDLSTQLARRGHDVGVATLRQPAGEPPPDSDGVGVHLLSSGLERIPGLPVDSERRYAPPGPDPLTVRDLRRVVRELRPQVVHGHNWLADSYLPLSNSDAAFALSLHDYSLVCATKRFFYRGGLCEGPGAARCLRHAVDYYGAAKGAAVAAGTRIADPWLRRRVDMFLPVSTAVRDLSGLQAGEGVRVIPNFVGALPPAPPAGDPGIAALPEQPFILYFGDVTEDKGVGLLVDAHRRLVDPPPLVLIGRLLLEGVDHVPGVHALGRLPHEVTIEAVRRSLFTVAPSILPESFGIVALEGAAAGKPVIASEIGGLKDVVVDGVSGLLVPAGDGTALRAALARLIDDAGLRERMGAAASERVKEFAPDVIVPRFESAYEEALERRRRRQGR